MQSVTQLRLATQHRLLSVKVLAAQYGVSKSTLYELIKSDPDFPYQNVGMRKKFMIDATKFEKWLTARTERQKGKIFDLPTAHGLLEKYKK